MEDDDFPSYPFWLILILLSVWGGSAIYIIGGSLGWW